MFCGSVSLPLNIKRIVILLLWFQGEKGDTGEDGAVGVDGSIGPPGLPGPPVCVHLTVL